MTVYKIPIMLVAKIGDYSALTERVKSLLCVDVVVLIGDRPDFSSSWRLLLKIYWPILLRTLQ